jgi:hypothetical protein
MTQVNRYAHMEMFQQLFDDRGRARRTLRRPVALEAQGLRPNRGVRTPKRRPMQIVIMLTLMTVLPAALMAITPFLRITIVLHFLRQALGTQSTPSNQVLIGLAMFLTIVIMQPVAADMYHQGWEPLEAGQITTTQAMDQAAKPLHNFLIRFAREKDVKLFVEISMRPRRARRRSRSQNSDSRLHSFRVEDRLPDRRRALPAVPGDRSGGGLGDALGGHDAIAARHDFRAVQDPAVRAGGRLEPGRRIADEELLPMTPDAVVQIVRRR